MKTKKILVLLMALTMVLAMIPAFAASEIEYNKAEYDLLVGNVMPNQDPSWGPYAQCPVCGTIANNGSDHITIVAHELATCEEAGYVEWACEERNNGTDVYGCGATYTMTIPALPHSWVPATGDTEWLPADGILVGYNVTDGTIPAKETAVEAVAKTATTNGLRVFYNECSVCERVHYRTVTVYADNYVGEHECKEEYRKLIDVAPEKLTEAEKATAATCTKPGSIKKEIICGYEDPTTHAVCGKSFGYTFVESKAYGHTLLNEAYNHAAIKFVEGEQMTLAQAELIKDFLNLHYTGSNPNKGHLEAKIVYANNNANTICGKDATLIVTCDECVAGKKTEILKVTLPATGEHNFKKADGSDNVIETLKYANCTENGLVKVECVNCGYTKEEVDEAVGHIYHYGILNAKGELIETMDETDEQTYGNDVEAWAQTKMLGCEAYTLVKVCMEEQVDRNENVITITICSDIQTIKKVPAKWSHDDVTVENYKNLCAADRFEILNDKSEIDPKNCTNEAYVVVQCKACKDFAKKLVIKEAGHVWKDIKTGTVKTEPTCQKEGEMTVKCEYCSATTIMPIAKKDHVPYTTHQGATTCTEAGTLTTKCNVCNETLKTETIPAGHYIVNGTRENCTRDGYKVIITNCLKVATEKGYCERCEKADQVNTFPAKTAHAKADKLVLNKNYWVLSESTCQKEGKIEYACANCQQTFIEYTPVVAHFSKADAIKDTGVVLKAATCTSEGVKLVYCGIDNCKATKEAPIAKAPHTFKYENNKLVCSVCGASEDMVDGHDYKVDTQNINMTSTSTSGTGKITSKDQSDVINHNGKLYARINFGYKLDNGEAVAYVTCVPVDAEGNFRMASPTAPYGATLTNVTVMITTAAQAQDMLIADVPNCGVTVLR